MIGMIEKHYLPIVFYAGFDRLGSDNGSANDRTFLDKYITDLTSPLLNKVLEDSFDVELFHTFLRFGELPDA